MYVPFGKRLFDFTAAAISLVLFAPLLFAIAVLVRLMMGTPILFRQTRPGLYGEPFTLLKFRTMLEVEDSSDPLLSDGQRLTALGQLLRMTSLDELPQLINVLRGDMSVVGPRPLLMRYLERYTPEQMRRHDVKPGMTGWAQVNGRNALSWEEKFEHDVWYVNNISFFLDLKILLRTLVKVIARSGVSEEGQVTSSEFLG